MNLPSGFMKRESEFTQLCLILCDSMDCSLSGSSLHGIFQARILEWGAISFSRVSSRPRLFTIWATREAHNFWFPNYLELAWMGSHSSPKAVSFGHPAPLAGMAEGGIKVPRDLIPLPKVFGTSFFKKEWLLEETHTQTTENVSHSFYMHAWERWGQTASCVFYKSVSINQVTPHWLTSL